MPLFGKLFDFDHDGKLDDFEKAAELGFFAQMMEDLSKEDGSDD